MIKLKVRHTPTQPATPWMVAVPQTITGTRRVRKYFRTEHEAIDYLNRVESFGFEKADIRVTGKAAEYQSPAERSTRSGWASSEKTIEQLYAWTAIRPDGQEEVIGMSLSGIHCPMIDSNPKRIEALREYAEEIGKFSNRKVQVVVFQRQVPTLPNSVGVLL